MPSTGFRRLLPRSERATARISRCSRSIQRLPKHSRWCGSFRARDAEPRIHATASILRIGIRGLLSKVLRTSKYLRLGRRRWCCAAWGAAISWASEVPAYSTAKPAERQHRRQQQASHREPSTSHSPPNRSSASSGSSLSGWTTVETVQRQARATLPQLRYRLSSHYRAYCLGSATPTSLMSCHHPRGECAQRNRRPPPLDAMPVRCLLSCVYSGGWRYTPADSAKGG